ncbi:Hsp20/alpha crystallin family protein [bacterium]|nr:Hsp20/alpha crystallin family protein [bacterium]
MAKNKAILLQSGERLLLEAQGASKQQSRAGWKLGHLFLTDRRVGARTGSRISLSIPLDNVSSVTVEKRPFVLCSKHVIVLACAPHTERGVSSRFWLITNELETWSTRLFQMTQLKVDEEAIARLAAALEPEAAAILWHIWRNHHANIEELARLVGAEGHSDVLLKIKAQINPLATEQLGCPILTLLPAGLDPRTGERVPYDWWIAGRRKEKREGSDPARIDVFDEETHVDVVVELPGVREEDILLDARDGQLVISGASTTGKFHSGAPLPPEVDPDSLTSQLNNGILLVRLKRSEACVR